MRRAYPADRKRVVRVLRDCPPGRSCKRPLARRADAGRAATPPIDGVSVSVAIVSSRERAISRMVPRIPAVQQGRGA